MYDAVRELRVGRLYIARLRNKGTGPDLGRAHNESFVIRPKIIRYGPVIIRSPSALARTSASSNLSALACVKLRK